MHVDHTNQANQSPPGATTSGATNPTGATPPAANRSSAPRTEPTRADQTTCPYCGNVGCPASGGTRSTGQHKIQYRKCGACERTFATRRRIITVGPKKGQLGDEELVP